jgi:predicted aspartyl protease
MKRYRYRKRDPADFPALRIAIAPAGIRSYRNVMFRLDTGADISVLPAGILSSLNARPFGNVIIADFDDRPTIYQSFAVDLRIANHRFHEVEIVASEGGAALLGLDILNQLNINLNGPKKTLTVL